MAKTRKRVKKGGRKVASKTKVKAQQKQKSKVQKNRVKLVKTAQAPRNLQAGKKKASVPKKTKTQKTPRMKKSRSALRQTRPSRAAAKSARLAVKQPDIFEGVHRTKIRIIGIGGGGGNIVAEISSRVQKFDFVGANTDTQSLKELPRKVKIFSFGQDVTRGLGCGMDAELGERTAKAEKERIKKLLEGSDICIIIASLGGGTGSGAAPVFAEVSQELKNLTLGIFTMPFGFEGDKRKQIAEHALEKLKPYVNAYVVIPNEKIFDVIDQKTPLKESLSVVNKRLANTLEGFIDTLSFPGLINVDFADVRSILEGKGRLAYINSAEATGSARAQEVANLVLANPLYEYGIEGADRILFNITGDKNLKMQEVAEISKAISDYHQKSKIVFGISCTGRFKDRIKVTLFAVGCNPEEQRGETETKQKKGRALRRGTAQKKRKKGILPRLVNKAKEKKEGADEANPAEQENSTAISSTAPAEVKRVRRNALDVKKAADEELKELEKKEHEWDIPAFLRNKSNS